MRWSQAEAARHLRTVMAAPPTQNTALTRWKSWERGRCLSPVYARAVAQLVGTHLAGPGLVRTVEGLDTTPSEDDMHRRQFLTGLTLLTAATTLAPARTGMAAGTSDAQALEHLVGLYRIADHRHGGAAVWEPAAAAARDAARMVQGSVAPQARAHLARVTADLHNVAGFASMDAGRLDVAVRQFSTATTLAAGAGDGALTARAHYCLARVHLHRLDWAAADYQLAQAEAAAAGSQPGVRAMMAASRAWSLSGLGRHHQAHQSMTEASRFLSRVSDPGGHPAWARYFTPGELEAVRGMALLAPPGGAGQAVRAFRAAAGTYPEGEARSSLLVRIGLGHALVAAGQLDEGVPVCAKAVADLGSVGSSRARDRLLRIRPDLGAHKGDPGVAVLDRRLAALART